MRKCHACQQELAETPGPLCPHCGVVLRPVSSRTIEDRTTAESINLELIDESDEAAKRTRAASKTVDLGPGSTIQFDAPSGKSPTLPDAANRTMEFTVPEEGGTIELPAQRKTVPLRADMTVDFSATGDDLALRVSNEWGDLNRESRQHQTIRQSGTVPGRRTSVPVKSRSIRARSTTSTGSPLAPNDAPDYELLEKIGQGGMGVVYAAHQSSIARTVAVKMLKPGAKDDAEQRDKFISEAVVTGELDHPNIVPIYDLGANDEGAIFYSMKRVRGTPWDDVIGQKSLTENMGILMRVADAVAFAHANGVIHRDLKPENVMLGDFGEVLVMDWGLARVTPEFRNAERVYQADSLGGTPAYMAPEMAKGPVEEVTASSDIYLLGAILYEIIGGRPPHSGSDVMQCLMAAARNTIDPITFEGELKEIALKALATKPSDRYETVKDFQAAIRDYQSHSESLLLSLSAERNLIGAREAKNYDKFARALFGFQEAVALWDGNTRAATGEQTARQEYAECALANGDLDLASSLIAGHEHHFADLHKKIAAERRDREVRARRLRQAKGLAAALVASIIGIITYSYFAIREQKNEAIAQRDKAVQQEQIANKAKEDEAAQRKVAVEQKEEAQRQEQIAKQAQIEEARQREIAVKNEQLAVKAKGEAEAAREAEEYEAYVARIGLAAAKIQENSFDFARELLDQCPPKFRGWEWGRLRYLTELDQQSFDAGAPVDAVAFSPDGKVLASGDWQGRVVLRDPVSGAEKFADKLSQYVHAVAYSPDGKTLATGASDGQVRLLDSVTGDEKAALSLSNEAILCVTFSPDGKQLAAAGYDNNIYLCDLATRRVVQTLQGHGWWVWSVAFSPDGEELVSASQEGKAIVWRRADGEFKQLTEFTGHRGPVYGAAWSPTQNLIATAGYDNTICVWNPAEVQPIDIAKRLEGAPDPPTKYRRLEGHAGPVRSVAFSTDGTQLVTASHDNTVRVWNVADSKLVQTLRGHASRVKTAVFSPDGTLIASGGQDHRVRLWDAAGYRETQILRAPLVKGRVLAGHDDAVLAARYSADGTRIVTASRDRTAALWDTATGKELQTFREGHEFLASTAFFFPAGDRLATGAGDNTVRVWNVAAGSELFTLTNTGRSAALAVAPSGAWLATGGPKFSVQLWDSESGQLTTTLSGNHDAEVTAIAISPSGEVLASGDDRGVIVLYQQRGSEWVASAVLKGHSRSITALRFAGADRLVSSSGDRTCGQWNVATGEELTNLVLKHDDWVSALDVSADGQFALTSCDDGYARLWKLADATVVAKYESPDSIFSAVDLSADGKRALLTSAAQRTVWEWDFGATVKPAIDLSRSGGLVWSATFDQSGEQILSIGGNDAQLWQRGASEPLMRFSPHGVVAGVDISPDGKLVATGSWASARSKAPTPGTSTPSSSRPTITSIC